MDEWQAVLTVHLGAYIRIFQKLVDEYGIAEVILWKSSQHVANDFLYFCVTRSCKTLMAVKTLILRGLPEDALILTRSLYENYVNIVYVLNNPEDIDHVARRKLGVSIGHYRFAQTPKGKIDRRTVVDPESGEHLPFGLSLEKLAGGSRHIEDHDVHGLLYSYLSEYTHPNLVALGSYLKPILFS